MEKLKDEVAVVDRKHFVTILEVIAIVMERISLRKALAYAQIEKFKIRNIEYMRITSRDVLKVISTDHRKPIEFLANVDIANLTKETLERIMQVQILTSESKPAQAKIAKKFKESIRKVIKDQDMYTKKLVFDIEVKEDLWWD